MSPSFFPSPAPPSPSPSSGSTSVPGTEVLYYWWALPVAAVLFALVGMLGLLSIVDNCRKEHRPQADDPRAGLSMRRWCYIFLSLAMITRAISLALEAVLSDGVTGFVGWVCALLRRVPELFFFSTFFLLIMFWARLYYKAPRSPAESRDLLCTHTHLYPSFLIANAALYLGFLAIALATSPLGGNASSGESGGDGDAMGTYASILFGSCYALAAAAMLYVGLLLTGTLGQMPRVNDVRVYHTHAARRRVLQRLVSVLCAVSCGVMAVRAGLDLSLGVCGAANTCSWVQHGYPFGEAGQAYRGVVDAVGYAVLELIPAVAIISLIGPLHGRRFRRFPQAGRSSASNMMYSEGGRGGHQGVGGGMGGGGNLGAGGGTDYVSGPFGNEATAMLAGGGRGDVGRDNVGGPLASGLGYGSDAFEYGAYDDDFDAGRGRLMGGGMGEKSAGMESMVRGGSGRV